MRILSILMMFVLFSCGGSNRLTECKTKQTKPKTIEALPDLKPENHNIFDIDVTYHVLANVIDTAEVISHITNSHNALNESYGKGFNFHMTDHIWFTEIDHIYTIDDASSRKEVLRSELLKVEEEDVINVYIFENSNQGLLGFTVVFPTCKDCYVKLSPKYDNILLSMEAIENTNSLVHEMGHFFGVPHPFKSNRQWRDQEELDLYGWFTDQAKCQSTMNYSCCAYEVTDEMLGIMWNYCGMHRYNLIKID
jgi:hypothetical protein